jgi:hypothetical protein
MEKSVTNTVSRIISDETLSCIIQIKRAGKPAAKASTCTATRLGRFLKATWLGVVAEHKPVWAAGLSQTSSLALRTDARCSIEMLGRFTEYVFLTKLTAMAIVAEARRLCFTQVDIDSMRKRCLTRS